MNYMPEHYDDNTFEPVTKRVYAIDGEYLSDWGGVEIFLLKVIKPFCSTTGFKIELDHHKIEFDTTTFSRTEILTVNQREYLIFDGDPVGNR